MAVAYPSELPLALLEKTRQQAAAFTVAQPRRGFGYVEPTGTDVPVFWRVTWRFTEAQARVFRHWFGYTLSRGTLPFTMNITTEFGTLEHECQFLPDDLLPARHLGGGVWETSATIMARTLIAGEPVFVDIVAPTNCGLSPAVGVTVSGLDADAVYRVTQPAGLTYSGWSAFSSGDLWQNAVYVAGSGSYIATLGDGGVQHASTTLAREAFPGGMITGHTNYTFWMNDNNPSDNRGGLSLQLQRIYG